MAGPVHMNQVIYQTPNVEKAQQAEHQNPDQIQRQASFEEQVQFRQRTETVQVPQKTENSREIENNREKRDKERKKKKRAESTEDRKKKTKPLDAKKRENGAGVIVDVKI